MLGSAARFSSAPGLRTNSVSWTIVHLECGTHCRAIEAFGVECWNRNPKTNDRLKVHFPVETKLDGTLSRVQLYCILTEQFQRTWRVAAAYFVDL